MTEIPKNSGDLQTTIDRPFYTLGQMALYALKLGAIGSPKPIALVGYMHRDLVEAKG